MGVILDSSIAIRAERRGYTADILLVHVAREIEDQEVALSAVGHTELVHGIYRADTDLRRTLRRNFLDRLTALLPVYAYNQAAAEIAGKIDAEARMQQVTNPYSDLLIGATALSLNFSILTTNVRHFALIPNLDIIPF